MDVKLNSRQPGFRNQEKYYDFWKLEIKGKEKGKLLLGRPALFLSGYGSY